MFAVHFGPREAGAGCGLRRRRGLALPAVLLIASIGVAPSAPVLSQAKSALGWVRLRGAEGCIDTAELARRVERLVGPVLVSASQAKISVEAHIGPAHPGFAATVVVADEHGRSLGERALRTPSADCRQLDDPLVFVIAVAIDPNAALAELPSEFAAEGEPERELLAELEQQPPQPSAWRPSVAPVRTSVAAPRVPAASRFGTHIAAEPMLALGRLPGLAFGLGTAVGLSLGEQQLWLRAGLYLPRDEPITGGHQVTFRLTELGLAWCAPGLRDTRWELGLCGGVSVVRLAASPGGFAGRERSAWAVGPSLGLRLGLRIASPLWLGLGLRAESLWPRHRLGYDSATANFRAVYRPPIAALIVTPSLELRF